MAAKIRVTVLEWSGTSSKPSRTPMVVPVSRIDSVQAATVADEDFDGTPRARVATQITKVNGDRLYVLEDMSTVEAMIADA